MLIKIAPIFPNWVKIIFKIIIGFILKNIPYLNNLRKNGLTVFLYHEISDTPSDFSLKYDLSVSNDVFRKQILFIKKNFNIISPDDLMLNKILPKNAALITFDDGLASTFENGINFLVSRDIPSIFFLNMSSILVPEYFLPAQLSFYSEREPNFKNFCKSENLYEPYFLSMTPSIFEKFNSHYKKKMDNGNLLSYQGPFVKKRTLLDWDNKLVFYGNHLYQHWNSKSLNDTEFLNQFKKNEELLLSFNKSVNFFSFPHGQYSKHHINLLLDYGVSKIFCSSGGINKKPSVFFLDRMCLTNSENSCFLMWYKIYLKNFKDYIKNL
jgi:peptidoglycan/xylan/chitin deacetylase (PgdA/CDA1 family)